MDRLSIDNQHGMSGIVCYASKGPSDHGALVVVVTSFLILLNILECLFSIALFFS